MRLAKHDILRIPFSISTFNFKVHIMEKCLHAKYASVYFSDGRPPQEFDRGSNVAAATPLLGGKSVAKPETEQNVLSSAHE